MYRIFSAILLTFLTCSLIGQGGENSPFSRFGIGDLTDENFMYSRAMGGLGASYNDVYNINIVNPASYASLKMTAFDIGVYAKNSSLSDDFGNESKQWSGNLEYISLAFPLSNPLNDLLERQKRDLHFGMSFTLMPNSTVGYNLLTEDVSSGQDTIYRTFRGSGGTFKFLWGNAVSYKNIAFGVNLGYVFGNLEYRRTVEFPDITFPFNSEFTNDYSVNGFIYKLGAQYTIKLNESAVKAKSTTLPKKLVLGLHGNTNTNFSTNANILDRTVQLNGSGQFIDADTLNFSFDQSGKGKLPATIGIGATYFKGEQFAFGVDFSTTSWNNYKNDANPETLDNTYKISAGGYIRPNYKTYNSLFKRSYYRYGAYYNTDPRTIDNKALTNYGVTFGLGFPFIYQRKISHANIGVNFGRRGQGTYLTENYMNLNFSFTFNDDEWFVKRKYD